MTYFLFILCFFFLAYAYLLYPAILKNKAKGKELKFSFFSPEDELPNVRIVLPVCNEERIIKQKINSILQTNYPKEKITIYIGVDKSTDDTLAIINTEFNLKNISVTAYNERQGKPSILNQLVEQFPEDDAILILTDANVLFTATTIFELVKYFKDNTIGLVDSNICPNEVSNENEKDYWNYEMQIKQNESIVFGIIPGPSGGCYAIRRALFSKIPDSFLVDDFYIGFTIATQAHFTIINKNAVCYEDMLTNWTQEFYRKIRISAGNFQNLWHFKKYALQLHTDIGKVFVSHKVIRWKTPFLLLIMYYLLLLKYTLFILIVTLFLPIIDFLLFTFGLKFKPLRQFHYFILMNIAVFIGFIKFCKGIKTNVWQPTTRN
ncbi:MAG: glycosyltransferase [Chitinophagales bacterium]|nr:glycosyltransferase [Chitinophagales bacterium]